MFTYFILSTNNSAIDKNTMFANHYQVQPLDEESNSSVDTHIIVDSSADSEVLLKQEIHSFQTIIYNAEIGKTILSKRKLRDLLSSKKFEINSDSESDLESDDEMDHDDLDSEIGDFQLQILRTILLAAEKNVLKLTRNMFMSIINDFNIE